VNRNLQSSGLGNHRLRLAGGEVCRLIYLFFYFRRITVILGVRKLLNKKMVANKKSSLSTWGDDIILRYEKSDKDSINFHLDNNNLRLKNKNIKVFDIHSFDIETITRRNDFYLFGYIDNKNVYTSIFNKKEAITKLLRLKHNNALIYATNLGFDFGALCDGSDLRSKSDILMRGNNHICIKLNGSYRKIKLLDSVNYGGLSVESMGKILKLPKLKKPRCLGRKPKNDKELKELVEYNKRDCEVTREFMLLFQKTVNMLGGELKTTISACSMDIFRRNFLQYDVIREELLLKREVRSKIFKAYYGGRTEAFKRGLIINYYYGDVNSLYPSVMLNDFPDPMSVKYINDYPFEDYNNYLSFEGVSYFELRIPHSKYPLLPLRMNNKLLFPYGYLKGYYTHIEVRRAVELYGENIIKTMNDTVYYTDTKPFFKLFVETLYKMRKDYKAQNNSMEHCVKILMNSLYGKFGMRSVEKTEFFNMDDYDSATALIKKAESEGRKIKMNSINEGYTVEKEDYDGVSSIPIWAVYVTAMARIKLHRLILEYEPVYVDTDSIVTRKPVIDNKELGELKLEKIVHKGIIVKPKLYFFDNEIKSKGIPIPKTQREKERLIIKILNGKVIKFDKFVKVKEGIGRDIKVNSILLVSKRVDLEDSKRVWNDKFNKELLQDSEPIFISEGDYEE
jgi:hypothetical protein